MAPKDSQTMRNKIIRSEIDQRLISCSAPTLFLRPQLPDMSQCCCAVCFLFFIFFTFNTFTNILVFSSLRTLYLHMVLQDLHQPKLSSNINTMPSNCSCCIHNIQENYRLMVRIAMLLTQLQMQSLGKGNLCVGKDEIASVPPVSTDSI
jgi:hypothetical protein